MFCQQCGTKYTTSTQRFCQECGAPITSTSTRQGLGAPRAARSQDRPDQSGQYGHMPSDVPPLRAAFVVPHVVVHDSALRTMLVIVGMLLLLPLAIPLFFGSLLAGALLVGVLLHMMPLVVIAIAAVWFLTRRRRMLRQW